MNHIVSLRLGMLPLCQVFWKAPRRKSLVLPSQSPALLNISTGIGSRATGPWFGRAVSLKGSSGSRPLDGLLRGHDCPEGEGSTSDSGSPLCQEGRRSRLASMRRSSPVSSRLRLTRAAVRLWSKAPGTARRTDLLTGRIGVGSFAAGPGSDFSQSAGTGVRTGHAGASSRPRVSSRARFRGLGVFGHLAVDDVGQPPFERSAALPCWSCRRRACGGSRRGLRCRCGAARWP